MIKYFILWIILIIIFLFTLFLYISDRKQKHKKEDQGTVEKKTSPFDVEDEEDENEMKFSKDMMHKHKDYIDDDDMEFLRASLGEDLKKEETEVNTNENTKLIEEPDTNTKTVEETDKTEVEHSTVEEDGDESATSDASVTFDEEEKDFTQPFTWPGEKKEESKKTGVPILDYRIILNHNIQEGSLYKGKEEYLIGRDKDCDIALDTQELVIGRKYLRVKPIEGKDLFVLEAVKTDWEWPVWSEIKKRWIPQTEQMIFGIEETVIVALTQFQWISEKEISRLELAVHGYLDKTSDPKEDFEDYVEDDDIFNI